MITYMKKVACFIVALSLVFSGCSAAKDNIARLIRESPYPLFPIPLLSFAPEVPLLPDTQNTLSGQLQEDIDKNIREGSIISHERRPWHNRQKPESTGRGVA